MWVAGIPFMINMETARELAFTPPFNFCGLPIW